MLTDEEAATTAAQLHAEGKGYRTIGDLVGRSRHWVRHRIMQHELWSGKQRRGELIPAGPQTGGFLSLFSYDQAREALARASTMEEVLSIADKAALFKELARRAQDREIEFQAHDIRARAERALGEQLRPLELRSGRPKRGKNAQIDELSKPRLKELGITPKLSARAQQLAALPLADFEARLVTWRTQKDRAPGAEILEPNRTEAKQKKRAHNEYMLGEAQRAGNLKLPTKRYGVILADPEWRFEPRSRETGMDRAADNHYPTSATEEIMARDIGSIAAKDCVLFLWATVPMLPDALKVMEAWGFGYKSHLVWIKDKIGTGYWFRNTHELLLVGTRGDIPAPAMGTQVSSVQVAPLGPHSEKPEGFVSIIEEMFPTLPKIELNHRGPARPGWDVWGWEANNVAA